MRAFKWCADLKADAALRAEAASPGRTQVTSPEDVVAFAAARGYDFTANELAEAAAGASGKQFSDTELDGVAAGADNGASAVLIHFAAGLMVSPFVTKNSSR